MKLLINIAALLLLVGVVGCANGEKQSVENKMAAEQGATSQEEMVMKTRDVLMKDGSLTETQREKMMALHSETISKMAGIRTEITKAKMVMFKSLLGEEANEKELSILKRKLVKLNTKKMNLMFDSMNKAKTILGKQAKVEHFRHWDFNQSQMVR